MSKKLKNNIKVSVGQAVFELLVKTNSLTVLIDNLKPLGLLIFQCHCRVPWTISYIMHILFFKVLRILR